MSKKKIPTWQERCEKHPDHNGIVTHQMIRDRMQEEIDDLRTALARRKWKWLTDDEVADLCELAISNNHTLRMFARAVELKLKGKNA